MTYFQKVGQACNGYAMVWRSSAEQLAFFISFLSAAGWIVESWGTLGPRPSQPQPEVLFLPFERVVDNLEAGDKWKVVDDWAEQLFAVCWTCYPFDWSILVVHYSIHCWLGWWRWVPGRIWPIAEQMSPALLSADDIWWLSLCWLKQFKDPSCQSTFIPFPCPFYRPLRPGGLPAVL